MADYRGYVLDPSGRILRASDLQVKDDLEAIELVRLWCEPGDVELWSGKRKVATVKRGRPVIVRKSARTGSET